MREYQWSKLNELNCDDAYLVHQSCHLFPWSEAIFEDCLRPPYFAYQQKNQRRVQGYYIGLFVAGECTLMDIGVAPCERSKGVGQQLLCHFFNQCKELNGEEVWLEVRASNVHAIALYQRNGFGLIETRLNYYPTKKGREDGLIMKKALA